MILSTLKTLFTKTKYYTFKSSDFEPIYLKRLENNKIFYNGYIYDENFFYYDKLNELFEHLNEHRDFFIKKSFENLMYWRHNSQIIRVIDFELDSNGECSNLLKCQYDILVDAYSYNIPYMSCRDYFYPANEIYDEKGHFKLIKDLLPDWLYINGWKSIKPVFDVFKIASYKFYNDGTEVYKESNYGHPLIRYGFTRKINKQFPKDNPNETLWGHETLWMDQWCIKKSFHETILKEEPKYFIRGGDFIGDKEYHLSDDDVIEDTENEYHLSICNQHQSKIDDDISKGRFGETENDFFFDTLESTKHEDIFIPKYNPLNEGARMREEWLEYDEKKKFEEFDINCKTNSYYTRYKYYNEIAWKDYPDEKKYKTDTVYDFTEEEIQENYENMIDKGRLAADRLDFVFKKSKNYQHLFNFLRQLEFIDLYLFRYGSYVTTKRRWGFWKAGQDTNIWTYEENKRRLYELLNDPQYLLIMPLLDAFFEMWRNNGWYTGDGSFNEYVLGYTSGELIFLDDCKRFMRAQKIYCLTLERQHFEIINDCWGLQDYIEHEIHEDIADDLEDVIIGLGMGIIMFVWLLLLTIYFGAYWAPTFELKYNSSPILYNYVHSWDLYYKYRPRFLWEIERKGPRNYLPHGRRLKTLKWRLSYRHRYQYRGWYWYRAKIFRPFWYYRPSHMPYMFEQGRFLRKWVEKRSLRRLLPLSLGWKAQYLLDDDRKVFGLNTINEVLIYFGRWSAISIYDLNGELRVRWWTRLRLYLKEQIILFALKVYSDTIAYINEPNLPPKLPDGSIKYFQSPEELEEVYKERSRRVRVVIFMILMILLILIFFFWIFFYFLFNFLFS